MPRYQIIITTNDNRRLHYRTDNKTYISVLYDYTKKALNVQPTQQLSMNELFVIATYLDDSISCEIIDHLTKKSRLFPL